MKKKKKKTKNAKHFRHDVTVIPDELLQRYATLDEVLKKIPEAINYKALMQRIYRGKFPKPFRPVNRKGPALFDRDDLLAYVREKYFLHSPETYTAFEKKIRAPQKK